MALRLSSVDCVGKVRNQLLMFVYVAGWLITLVYLEEEKLMLFLFLFFEGMGLILIISGFR